MKSKRLEAVSSNVDLLFILEFIDKLLHTIIHHRNQLKNFRMAYPVLLENLSSPQIHIDVSENLTPLHRQPQSMYWNDYQLSAHSGIMKVNEEKYYHPYFSPDLSHD